MTEEIQFGNGRNGEDELELRKAAGGGAETDAGLDGALAEFRLSVHAWSEAAYSRARIADLPMRRRSWRLAAGWALGCALMAGGVTGGILEHQQQKTARIAATAEQQAQQQLATAQEQAHPREQNRDPNLMAKVDSDTAQEVPDAMQPLAQLMEVGGNQ
ncbi:MAG: hypothetical protein ACRD25_12970 [Terracidiphilus sp.]